MKFNYTIYFGLIMFVLSYAIFTGPRSNEVLAYWLSGAAFGGGLVMIGTCIILINFFKESR